MAKVGVLEAHQARTDRPARYVKRSAAQCLVRKNLAHSLGRHLIQLIAVREAIARMQERPEIVEIPSLLPIRPPDWFFTSYPIQDQRTCEYSY